MTMPLHAAAAAAAAAAAVGVPAPEVSHVFATTDGVDRRAVRLAALIDTVFVTEAGWDPARSVLCPPPAHPLMGRPVCRVDRCSTTAPSWRRHWNGPYRGGPDDRGLGPDEIDLLPATPGRARGPGGCAVNGCGREWVSSRQRLCRAHLDQAATLGLGVAGFCGHRAAQPLAACDPCGVAACVQQRRHPEGVYCVVHQLRLRSARRQDEDRRQRTETPVGRGGQISLRGLAPAVIAEVLVGLQQRSNVDGAKTKEADLRRWCNELRAQQAATGADYVLAAGVDPTLRSLVNAVSAHARRALSSPETEIANDVWDLVVFGHTGRLSLTKISQPWLREVAKRWAADDLPRRRSTTGRGGLVVRHHL